MVALSLGATGAVAQSVASDLRGLRAALASLQSQAGWDLRAEQAFVDDVDALVAGSRASGSSGETARGLRELLESAHRRYADSLDRERNAIIAADGDLEAAQEDPSWQLREELGLRMLYHLNWAYLESATRYESRSPRRREWLRSAVDGFGEFVGVEGDAALVAESLYGRALCRRALDQPAKAVPDLRRALKVPAPPELVPRIGSALVESLVDTERLVDAEKASRDLLQADRSGESEFLRAKVLLLTLASPGGSKAKRRDYRREVTDCVARLERRGGRWARLGRQLVSAGITRPEEWLEEKGGSTIQWVVAESLRGRGKCGEAIPLYEKVVASEKTPTPEALLALGACHFEVQAFAAAYETLARVASIESGGETVADAAYLRFKAAEALEHAGPGPESTQRLESAARAYLAAFPDHPQAFEGHYRLGEIERARGELVKATAAFDAVGGESTFHLRALFQAAQCTVEEWEKQAAAASGGEEELARDALARLGNFLAATAKFRNRAGRSAADEVMLSPMEAHARVLSAAVLTSRQQGEGFVEALSVLEDFEQRYPGETEVHAGANALRAVALLGLDRFGESLEAVRAFLASPRRNQRDYRLMQQLGVKSMELAERERVAGNSDGESSLHRQALILYEKLLEAVEAGEVKGDPEGLRVLVGDLRSQRPGAQSDTGPAPLRPSS